MYLFFEPREHFLAVLPKDGVAAEIGVAVGDFSAAILKFAEPQKLHLIDPWEYQDRADYHQDPNNITQSLADQRFAAVENRFGGEVASGKVEIHRAYSTEVACDFEDGYFDWLYLDAMHTFDAAIADLEAFWPKLKPDGFLLGHDYANHEEAEKMDFGVVEAVNKFVDRTGCDFTALNIDAYPTYILSKDVNSARYRAFIANATRHLNLVAEVKDVTKKTYSQTVARCSDGFVRVFPLFE